MTPAKSLDHCSTLNVTCSASHTDSRDKRQPLGLVVRSRYGSKKMDVKLVAFRSPWEATMRALIVALVLIAGSVAFSGPAHAQKSKLGPPQADGVEPRAPVTPSAERRARSRTQGDSRSLQTGDMDSVGRRIERWKPVPADHKRTPDQSSPEWTREQAEAAEKDRALDRKIRSICRGC